MRSGSKLGTKILGFSQMLKLQLVSGLNLGKSVLERNGSDGEAACLEWNRRFCGSCRNYNKQASSARLSTR